LTCEHEAIMQHFFSGALELQQTQTRIKNSFLSCEQIVEQPSHCLQSK